jgi:hypothetical protein
MATNIGIGATVPAGWFYSAMKNGYDGPNGEYISGQDITVEGSFAKAFMKKYGATGAPNQMAIPPGANGPAGPFSASISGAAGGGTLSVSTGQSYTFANPPTNVIAIETKLGRVGINIETGDITIPPGIGRDEAIREFWLGFQKHFVPSNKAKYEKEIAGLKSDYQRLENYYKDKLTSVGKDATKPIVEKIRKKYGNEKFIMVKPEDLISFIENQ